MQVQCPDGRIRGHQARRHSVRPPIGGQHFIAFAVTLACLLSPRTGTAATWHVPGDAPTIQAGINLAFPGDDVLVAPGTYLEHDIVMKAGVWVHSEQGPDLTAVDAGGAGVGFTCLNLDQMATIEGFTILNGHAQGDDEHDASGGGVKCVASPLAIVGCVIRGCLAEGYGGGVYASESGVAISTCKFVDCHADGFGGGIYAYHSYGPVAIADSEFLGNQGQSGGGIWATSLTLTIARSVLSENEAHYGVGGGIACMSPALTISDCLVTQNSSFEYFEGGGLSVNYSAGSIEGCTVANNSSFLGGAIKLIDANIRFDRMIIAFNDGDAMECSTPDVSFHCSDLHGNAHGNDICGDDLGGNFSADPLFCDAENGDYALDANSPCIPGNHPNGVDCGLIGALGLGCGAPPPTGACCFADGSCVVLEQQQCEEQGGSYQGDGSTCEPDPCEPTPVENTTWGRIKMSYR